jgi:hypothetical protein
MKRQFSLLAAVLLSSVIASAQLVASHTPTAPAQSAFATTSLQPVGKPVARVNGAVLTDRDLLREMFTIFPYARQHNGSVPKAMEADIRRGALKMIEFEELVYQEAVRRNLTIPPERMTKALADFRNQFRSPEDYQQFMKDECQGSRQVLRAKIRRSLLIEALLKTEVQDKSTISIAQAKAYFDKNPDHFRIPESWAIQTISVLPPPNASAEQLTEARKRADEALKQAKATKSYEEFGVLAEKISEDDWRVMMGDRRAVDKTKMPPEVMKVLAGMKPGQVSDLIQVGQAYTIVRLNAYISPGMQKFDAVKDSLRKQLQTQKTEELRAGLDARLRKTARIEEL